MTNTKQTQDDRTIQPFNCSTIQRVKKILKQTLHTGSLKIFKILKQVQNDKNFGSLCKVQNDT